MVDITEQNLNKIKIKGQLFSEILVAYILLRAFPPISGLADRQWQAQHEASPDDPAESW